MPRILATKERIGSPESGPENNVALLEQIGTRQRKVKTNNEMYSRHLLGYLSVNRDDDRQPLMTTAVVVTLVPTAHPLHGALLALGLVYAEVRQAAFAVALLLEALQQRAVERQAAAVGVDVCVQAGRDHLRARRALVSSVSVNVCCSKGSHHQLGFFLYFFIFQLRYRINKGLC